MAGKKNDWNELVAQMPAVLREVLSTEPWDVDLSDYKTELEQVPLESLAWALDLPVWGWRGEPFKVTPNQVRADPKKYAVHFARVMWADLADPLHLAQRNGRWVVLDGYHRLLRAFVEGRSTIPAIRLTPR